jgi:DNA helicase-2/ATP-dependent DNA helicase PcrA
MPINPSSIFDGLNEPQKRAVMSLDGPVLIIAGPGTGKTMTIVRRIACLVHQGARPENILAVTFTNRAAREMRERTTTLLGSGASRICIGTLHLLGLRIMQEASAEPFTVYSREEQIEVLKPLVQGSVRKARQAAESISRRKNLLEPGNPLTDEIYGAYQESLRQNHAVDFDDLIIAPIGMLENGAGTGFTKRFTHIMVDEYQDINPAQYQLLHLLAKERSNFCAIGDSDQAIYGFRGADAGAFLNFGRDFRNAERITLGLNYRSTGTVLAAAGSLIRNNQRRIEKEIVATKGPGRPISAVSVPDEGAEGGFIVREIEARIGGTSHDRMRRAAGPRKAPDDFSSFSDFAVVYRTNAQAKAIEEAFLASGIPYQVIGRRSSLQSKELDGTLAYLRSIANPGAAAGPVPEDANEARLLTTADFFDPRADAVTLTTLHTAKGLEFRVVFLAGVEDGLMPYTATGHDADIEEERRLFYVGMTRARDELYLLYARSRFLYGRRMAPSPSPFLREIPGDLMEHIMVPDKPKKQKEPDQQLGLF